MSANVFDDELLGLSLPSSRPYKKAVIGAPNTTVLAPAGDSAVRSGGNDLLVGSSGDNTFFVYSAKDKVVDDVGGGVDTIVSTQTYVLPDNVENLRLVGSGNAGIGSITGIGNALDNLIIGDSGNQTLDGGGGNNVLTGGGGADLFIIKAGDGSDLLTDFGVGNGNPNDRIRLAGFGFTTFAQVQAAAVQVGNDLVIHLSDTQTLGLKNVSLATLGASAFQLDLDRSGLVHTFGDDFDSLSLYDPANNPAGTWRTVYSGSANASSRTLVTEGEKEIYVDSSVGINPFSVGNGVLTISARDMPADMAAQLYGYKYTSGLITSKFSHSQLYGVFEISAKLPAEASAWPAFWLLPTDNASPAEIDIFENLGSNPAVVTNTIHTAGTGTKSVSAVTDYVGDVTAAFHTYALDWEPDTITWYVDGVQTFQIATPADMHKPMYMLANLAIGAGGLSPAGPLNADMQIDYIHAYQRGTAITGTGSHDVFTVTSQNQIVQEAAGGTDNTVYSSIDYLLPDNVQTLILTGTADLRGYGNAQDSTIIGNAGNDILEGSFGNDLIMGGNGNNTLLGDAGNDTLVMGTGSNSAKGGDGYDTAVMAGASGDYIATVNHGIGALVNRVTGAIDTLSSVETVRFTNGTLAFEGYGMTGGPAQIYRLYDVALGRAPTASEMAALLAPVPAVPGNWTMPFANGLTLAGVAAQVMASTEYLADTAGMSIAQQIAWFYKAALLAPGDAGGLAHWQDQAAQGVALTAIITGISESNAVLAQTGPVTNVGLFIPDNPASADTPIAPTQVFAASAGAALPIAVSTLTSAASDPGGENLTLGFVGHAQHGSVTMVNGTVTFTPNAYFSGDASFTYTIANTDLVASTGTVIVHVAGTAPPYINDLNLTANRTYDFSGSSQRQLLVAGSGNDTVIGGDGGGSYRLGSGTATVIGGAGSDTITFGAGAATVTGGGGADVFTLTKGMIANPAVNGGFQDVITDFTGAGNGARSGDDVLRLVGFSTAATFSYVGDLANDPTGHIYAVDDGSYHASLVVHYASGGTRLVAGDFGFFAS